MGNHSGLICPECGGGLDETGFDEHVHFRCRVVHAFGAETLLAAQEEETEQALWAAVRLLEDRSTPLDKLEEHARGRGDDPVARHYGRKARESTRHANRLRQLVEHDAGESPTDEDGVEASAGG